MDIYKEATAEFHVSCSTVGLTAIPIHAGMGLIKGVVIRAGAKAIAFGSHPGVTYATGFVLLPNEQSPLIRIDDLNKVWVVGSEAGCPFSWFAQ